MTTTGQAGERGLLAALPGPDKVRLLSGQDSWRTHGCDPLGLRPMITSDGPAGARGMTLDDRSPASCLPCPSALGATWDPALVREVAAALGAEARGKGIDILLAPTINLMRTPLGGRGFECFSEDPELTARIAVAYVLGVQGAGVAATVKHFVGNDSETERWTYDARISEQVLRELYLVPFEACVREAGVALVMAAYNAVNGSRMTEHHRLLREVLKQEWGFAGAVTSDWDAARSTTAAANAGLDLAMPGPNRFWGQALADALADGTVPAEVIDDKLARLLWLARQVGALTDGPASSLPPAADGRARITAGPVLASPELLRRVAASSFVMLRNAGDLLPLDPGALRRVAVIGPNAEHPVIQGGGSAGVIPVSVSAPADALRRALAGGAEVTAVPGCRTWVTVPAPPAGSLADPVTGEPGLRLEFRSPDGTVLASEHRNAATFAWWGTVNLPAGIGWDEPGVIELRTRFLPAVSGPHLIGAAAVGRITISADGKVIADEATRVPGDPVEAMTRPGEVRAALELTAGQAAGLSLRFRPAAGGDGPLALRLGIAPCPDEDAMLADAVAAAAAADAAVVIVGTPDGAESEGFDRDTLALPGRQDELVRRVAAVNSRTVVVVNAGMPVLMPWAGEAGAVLYAWLPGQAMGDALADVLLGRAEPGGRLPVTLPAAEADCPVLHARPRDGRLDYAEGLLMGYRGYDAGTVAPAFPFGHGLGYTTWAYEELTVASPAPGPGQDLLLRVRVRNTGPRPGREIVQAYAGQAEVSPGRPVRVLAAFAVADAGPGEVAEVTLRIPDRVFAVYDEAAGWTWPPGEFAIWAGRSSRDLRLSERVRSG